MFCKILELFSFQNIVGFKFISVLKHDYLSLIQNEVLPGLHFEGANVRGHRLVRRYAHVKRMRTIPALKIYLLELFLTQFSYVSESI